MGTPSRHLLSMLRLISYIFIDILKNPWYYLIMTKKKIAKAMDGVTPGPYKVVVDKTEVYVCGADGLIIAFCDNAEIPKATQLANAKAIAYNLNR